MPPQHTRPSVRPTDTVASTDTAQWYQRFAEVEAAHGRSPLYENWARAIAVDPEVLSLVDRLPEAKRQPNLVFGAARALGAPDKGYQQLRPWLLDHWTEVAQLAQTRSTQTNEAARCATLLPVLARLPGPLALLEVGASAGLCLYPDRYGYSFEAPDGAAVLEPADGPSSVRLTCRVDALDGIPASLPEVCWRAGVDLNPLDVDDAEDLRWLTNLVWPEHHERRDRLAAAAQVVAAEPPRMFAGDLNEKLPEALAAMPADATRVVFHTAVLAYLTEEDRRRFVDAVQAADVVWISNEGPGVLPDVTAKLPASVDPTGHCVLAVDGEPVALTGMHGDSYAAVGPATSGS